MFNLRAKTQRNDAYTQISTFESLNDVLTHVSHEEYSNAEITKDGKLFFVFTVDEKTRILLDVIKELSEVTKDEVIPKPKRQSKNRTKKQKVE